MTYNGSAQEQKSEKYYHFLVGGAVILIVIIALIVVLFGGNEKKNMAGTDKPVDNQSQNDMKYVDSERQIREIKLNDKTIKECKENVDKITCKDMDGKEISYPRNLEQNFIY